jgi:hypothetical protein
MNLLDRHFPLLSWIPKAREVRLIPKKPLSKMAKTRDAYIRAKQLKLPILKDAVNASDISAVQFQIGRPRNMRFLPIDQTFLTTTKFHAGGYMVRAAQKPLSNTSKGILKVPFIATWRIPISIRYARALWMPTCWNNAAA